MVALTIHYRREGNLWRGHCVELGLSTHGNSLASVQKGLEDMIDCRLSVLDLEGIETVKGSVEIPGVPV